VRSSIPDLDSAIEKTTETDGDTALKPGWALKSSRKRIRFSDEQKRFMRTTFKRGQDTGCKMDADQAAKEMRNLPQFKK